MDRRHFLLASSAVASGGLVSATAQATGRSVLEFGVKPGTDQDQGPALQKAANELSSANQSIILPGGIYHGEKLVLPSNCSLIGVPGRTILAIKEIIVEQTASGSTICSFSGLTFEPKVASVNLTITGSHIAITDCQFFGGGKTALKLDGCYGNLEALYIRNYSEGIAAANADLTISRCRFEGCNTGITAPWSRGVIIAQNKFDGCGTGIAADGIGIVNGNLVKDAKEFGLKLGRPDGHGRFVTQSNLLQGCRVGIGVAASGDDIFASLNLINAAKDGAIRAFDGDRLVGRDLARESAEVYLNLTVAGNVVR